MFGSDWPVCNIGGPRGEAGNWGFWREAVSRVLEEWEESEKVREGVWWRTGERAYGIEL
jgi:predicted TIM-barrel fold metal-dependent hydrolase